METKDENEEHIMQYLLGDLAEEEQGQLEERFFVDDALYEELRIAERELIDRYVLGQLTGRERERFEHRFLLSSQRREKVALARSFRQAMAAVTAQAETPEIARPPLHERLATALQQAQHQVADPAWRARLARWQTRWAGKAQAAARLVVEAADQATRVMTEGLEALTTPGNQWDFALTSTRVSARGPGEDRDVSQGAAGPGPTAPQVSIRVGQTSHEATRRIQVSVRALPAQPVLPLVLLIPATAGGVPQVAALAPWPRSAWLVAQFQNVLQGDYLLAFEPMEDINPT
jgi:hypothetical protein